MTDDNTYLNRVRSNTPQNNTQTPNSESSQMLHFYCNIKSENFWNIYLKAHESHNRGKWKINHVQQIQSLLLYFLNSFDSKIDDRFKMSRQFKSFEKIFFVLVNYNNKEWSEDDKMWKNVKYPTNKVIDDRTSGLKTWKEDNQISLKSLDMKSDHAIILKCQEELLDLCKTKNKFYNNCLDEKKEPKFMHYPESNDGMYIFHDMEEEQISMIQYIQNPETNLPPTNIEMTHEIVNNQNRHVIGEVAEQASPNQESTNVEISQYKDMIAQLSLEIDAFKIEIGELKKYDTLLASRIDTLNAMVHGMSTSQTSNQPTDKPDLKKSTKSEFLHLKRAWKDYDKETKTIDEFFNEKGNNTLAGYKAQSRFYGWLAVNDTKRRFTFDLDSVSVELVNARKQFIKVKRDTKFWKNCTKEDLWFFTPPEKFGKDANPKNNIELTIRRIKEAWKKAVIWSDENGNDKNSDSFKFYNTIEQDGKSTRIMFGSNMLPDNYDLVFD